MDHLKNTSWFLVEIIGESGWTIYPDSAREPGNFLRFRETQLVNWDFRMGSEKIPLFFGENEIQIRDGLWAIDRCTRDTLILRSHNKKYVYRNIEPAPQKTELPEIVKLLTTGIWTIEKTGEFTSNLLLFLNEKLEKSDDFLPDYSILLRVGYHKELIDIPSSISTMSGWKLNELEKFCFLSLYDLENGHQHFELKSFTKNQMLFKGVFELKLEKIN